MSELHKYQPSYERRKTHRPRMGENAIDPDFGAEPGFYDMTKGTLTRQNSAASPHRLQVPQPRNPQSVCR